MGVSVATVSAMDADSDNTLSYAIISGTKYVQGFILYYRRGISSYALYFA